MHISNLVTDEKNGRLSYTKVWSNIGLAALTVVFIHRAFYGSVADMELEYWAYGLLVTAPNLVGKFFNMRFGGNLKSTDKKEDVVE